MKFIASSEALGELRERFEDYRYFFASIVPICDQTLSLVDQVEKTKGPIKAERIKAKIARNIESLEWDCTGFFHETYEAEFQETIRLMKEAFGLEEPEFQIPDFAPPVD